MPNFESTAPLLVLDFFIHFYAPNFEKVGDILVSACPYVYMCVCIHVRDIVLNFMYGFLMEK